MVSRYEHFTTAISSIYHHFQKLEREEMDRFGLRGTYTEYLLAIDRATSGITAAELSKQCEKDKAAVSRALAEMEKQGLVFREISGERAYRARLILTDEGKRAAEIVRHRAAFAVELAGHGLSDTEREVMYAALQKIAENLNAICRDGLPDGEKSKR